MGVVMERRILANRWQTEQWVPIAVDTDAAESAPPQLIYKDMSCERWLHPGLEMRLYRDEAEGYFLNCSTAQPVVFVSWRMEEDRARPWLITASYNEASRLLDAGEQVEGVPMPEPVLRDVSAYVQLHYRPQPKKRIRPPSFRGARRDE